MPDARVVAGRYRLIAKLSEGGMGSVWSAEHMELKCPAAVKLLSSMFAESPEALARFKREAQSAASLRSTNIVQILDFGIDDGVPFIAMELLRGRTLADRLSADSRIEPRETAAILSQVARAVTWAHGMGIIHRDLKPGNIFLSQDAGDIVVKLLDFGIAKPMSLNEGEASMTLTGTIVGTPQYMSPEQASGRRAVDHRTDIWSFGVIAYECITGKRAFVADTLGGLTLAICTDPLPVPSKQGPVPKGFDEWFARCSHRDPGRRFLSIAEAADILRFICGLDADAAAMPQLYSEPPPSQYNNLRVSQRSLPAGVATDAPSTISLGSGSHTNRGTLATKAILATGLFAVAGAGVALVARLNHGSHSAPAAELSPRGIETPAIPQRDTDAGEQLKASTTASAQELALSPPPAKPGAARSAASTQEIAQESRPKLGPVSPSTRRSEPLPRATQSEASVPFDSATADITANDANQNQHPVATTVEGAIGLRRRP